jgi:hypothetical protein
MAYIMATFHVLGDLIDFLYGPVIVVVAAVVFWRSGT